MTEQEFMIEKLLTMLNESHLKLIKATNPGIDMDAVHVIRVGWRDSTKKYLTRLYNGSTVEP